MPPRIRNKTQRADAIRKVKAGLLQLFASTPLVLAGTTYTPAELQSVLQDDIEANDASTRARAQWIQAAKAARQRGELTNRVLRGIRAQVEAQYGEAPEAQTILALFGYEPRRAPDPTVAEKEVAVAKRQATREARHTLGPKARARIHGAAPATEAPPERSEPGHG